ncbi:MAG TPA: M48 family metallopeptidase [Gemmataceae bacterium]|nr:M48 family metallopeptidase [Gemmataceae bacterium]
MPFLLLLYLTLACLVENWEPWPHAGPPLTCALLTWLGVALEAGLAALISWRACRGLRRDPGRRDRRLRRYHAWRFYHTFVLFGVYGVSLYLVGWGWVVQCLYNPGRGLFPGAEVLVLAPFLVGLVLSWFFFYDAERAFHDTSPRHDGATPFWSRRAYLSFHARHNLALVFIPVLLLIVEKGVSRFFPGGGREWEVAASVLGFGAAMAVFVCIPLILRLVLGLRPLPEGPMRDRLLTVARRLHFRCADILLWNTRGGVANAMVAGVLPRLRYVLLTDRLLNDLTPEEVEAVFGHEVGHVKHHHMLYYLGFLLTSIAAMWVVLTVAAAAALDLLPPGQRQALQELLPKDVLAFPFIGILGAYIFLVFGFLSRRCERQADIYGCRAVSCSRPDCGGHAEGAELAAGGRGLCPTGIRTFIEALEKVARLNGIHRDRPGFFQSWQHSTIARRVEFLQRMLADPTLEPRFQRRVALVKWGLLVALGVTLLALAHAHGWGKLLQI